MEVKGKVYRVAGPVVTVVDLDTKMYDVVKVGHEGLMGEVIKIVGNKSIIQVYEETSGIKPGEPVENTGLPLSVELGPGLLESIYDGIQRPLSVLKDEMGNFIKRGVSADGLDHDKFWEFNACVKKGDTVKPGDVIGTVQETENIEHRIMVPPNMEGGEVAEIKSGKYTVDDVVCKLKDGTELKMAHRWPVRAPRPVTKKLAPKIPLITGQRVLDAMFPVAKGGTAAIPGPFGSGKTVTQQQLAKWSDANIVVYIGCGERGNEMAEVLNEFPELEDPQTGRPLMERTVLIANTSNMPVAAREASVYTGITIAEYFRDMGYDIALMADSTSRWAEAMREISSRLEEMPGEEGYPAYLSARLAEFYERAGVAQSLNDATGSITVIGAVSPAGGDFSEPVTQNTLRIVKVFWALDAKLSQKRHFPAINWLNSYTLYQETLAPWFTENVAPDWNDLRGKAMEILQLEAELNEIVQLVGSDALPESQQVSMESARMIREIFLQQNSFHPVDTYCSFDKQYKLLKSIMRWDELAAKYLADGAPVKALVAMDSKAELGKIKYEENFDAMLTDVMNKMEAEFAEIGSGGY
ncbi:ATP synthase subunit A [Methanimicrococcus blatticola]|uniref:A-type ATP synthase subunit A n=1 Tax=Methanimicrococcus blatticola TaxID=91560 RepID=A0A484F4V4_9EURY|nr:ATP synthase subunit A [Methanimicrococcus blatticola]MBZ3935394.1 ATP synthase subunit A [Methanimicrococcus blatticola]MCC2508508.1 ATP synthase subunit A [Methanimicrococcus blatticola]TDQ67817.1 V/A-type H+-transporting ATPase subunit A [Methanimicrococcus blatticola]